MEKDTKKYVDGLNKGYLMAEYEPELFKSIAQSLEGFSKPTEFTLGMLDGGQTYLKIVEKDRGKSKVTDREARLGELRKKGRDLDLEL